MGQGDVVAQMTERGTLQQTADWLDLQWDHFTGDPPTGALFTDAWAAISPAPRDKGLKSAAYYDPKPEYWDVPLMRNGDVIERPVDHRTLTKRYTEEAIRFINKNRTRPFFLYLAHSMPHIPLARSAAFEGHSAGGIYGDVIEELDSSTGRILDALKAAGLDRNTLVVFTSDNGPWLPFGAHGGSPGPLREGKGTTWEGGVRTPAIFWWPGTVQPSVVMDMGSAMDLFVTAASFAGAALPSDRVIDGVDLRARLVGAGPSPRRVLFYYWDDEIRAVRKGVYKAHFITSGAYGEGEPRQTHDPPLLFNLAEDPGERNDVAAMHPDIVADLIGRLKRIVEAWSPGDRCLTNCFRRLRVKPVELRGCLRRGGLARLSDNVTCSAKTTVIQSRP